jgi:hypothetical protein
VAGALTEGASVDLPAALVKDLGTQFEREVIDEVVAGTRIEPDPGSANDLARLSAEALLHAPGFTLRGGTTEVLRGVIARGMGLR